MLKQRKFKILLNNNSTMYLIGTDILDAIFKSGHDKLSEIMISYEEVVKNKRENQVDNILD